MAAVGLGVMRGHEVTKGLEVIGVTAGREEIRVTVRVVGHVIDNDGFRSKLNCEI
jgi:hypothetical protein